MNLYQATINLPECAIYETAWFPDTPRTAVLVKDGVLVPVTRSILEPAQVPSGPVNDGLPESPVDETLNYWVPEPLDEEAQLNHWTGYKVDDPEGTSAPVEPVAPDPTLDPALD